MYENLIRMLKVQYILNLIFSLRLDQTKIEIQSIQRQLSLPRLFGHLLSSCQFYLELFNVNIQFEKGQSKNLSDQTKIFHYKQSRKVGNEEEKKLFTNLLNRVDFADNDDQQTSKYFEGLHIQFQTDSKQSFFKRRIIGTMPVNFFPYIGKFEFLSYNINHNPMQKIKGKQQWTQEQKKMLAQLFPKFSSNKWKIISIEMAQKGYKRTQIECRQKWIHFLDPSLNNEEWSQQQLERLYHYHDKYGTRWCFIQKELNRAQNRIKNRFYGTIRNYIRLVMNTLCQRQACLNTQINKISASLLNDLYNSENIFDFLRGQIKKMIYMMKFKIDKKMLRQRIREKQHLYRELLGSIGSLFKASFSLKFYSIVAYSDSDKDEEENDFQNATQQVPQQKKQATKTIQKQDKIILQRYENQLFLKDPIDFESKKITFKIEDINIEQIEQYQHQNAKQYMRKLNAAVEEIKPANDPIIISRNEANYSYPLFGHSPIMLSQHQWIMNPAYREPFQQHIAYELLIDKIRQQNLLLMQRQQEQLLSQFKNNFHIHTINSHMQNMRQYQK